MNYNGTMNMELGERYIVVFVAGESLRLALQIVVPEGIYDAYVNATDAETGKYNEKEGTIIVIADIIVMVVLASVIIIAGKGYKYFIKQFDDFLGVNSLTVVSLKSVDGHKKYKEIFDKTPKEKQITKKISFLEAFQSKPAE